MRALLLLIISILIKEETKPSTTYCIFYLCTPFHHTNTALIFKINGYNNAWRLKYNSIHIVDQAINHYFVLSEIEYYYKLSKLMIIIPIYI